jgi:hypothetical protein
MTLGGFMTVNRDRLKALSGDELARLAASGDLDLIYAHLHSQRNFTPTAERIGKIVEPASEAPAGEDIKAPASV